MNPFQLRRETFGELVALVRRMGSLRKKPRKDPNRRPAGDDWF